MKKIIYLMLIGCLLITSCSKDEENDSQSNSTDIGLNGKWLASDGTGISIEGNTGTFYAFSANWTTAKNLGYVKTGDIKLKEITKKGDNEWSYYELLIKTTGGNISGVKFSNLSTMKLSSDKKTLNLTTYGTTDTGEARTFTSTFFKQ